MWIKRWWPLSVMSEKRKSIGWVDKELTIKQLTMLKAVADQEFPGGGILELPKWLWQNCNFTVCNEVAKVVFLQSSVCPQEGVCLSACWDITPPWSRHPLEAYTSQSRHPPWSRHPSGTDTSREQTPPERWKLLSTVHILLECILVAHFFADNSLKMKEFGPRQGVSLVPLGSTTVQCRIITSGRSSISQGGGGTNLLFEKRNWWKFYENERNLTEMGHPVKMFMKCMFEKFYLIFDVGYNDNFLPVCPLVVETL